MPVRKTQTLPPVLTIPSTFLIITFLFLMSCNPNVIYDNTKKIPENVWYQEEKIRFEVPVSDTISSLKFFLNIRHSTDYRYSNIYFFINSTFPDGTNARDTVECILARPDGKWLGKGMTGIRDNQLLIRRGLVFPMSGTYVFEFEQAMREKELVGISDIGLRLEKE